MRKGFGSEPYLEGIWEWNVIVWKREGLCEEGLITEWRGKRAFSVHCLNDRARPCPPPEDLAGRRRLVAGGWMELRQKESSDHKDGKGWFYFFFPDNSAICQRGNFLSVPSQCTSN